jgi:hypothetical protein
MVSNEILLTQDMTITQLVNWSLAPLSIVECMLEDYQVVDGYLVRRGKDCISSLFLGVIAPMYMAS